MKVRDVVIFTGKHFRVPQGIQRIDHRATHGWQLRYGGTKLFSDGAEGPRAALERATSELLSRIAKLPAPSRLQRAPAESKTSGLPVGIFGPVVRLRKGARVHDCSFSVLQPRFGQTPRRRSVYIGNENTYTVERYRLALAKAIALREDAERTYRREATKAKRAGSEKLMARHRQRAMAA